MSSRDEKNLKLVEKLSNTNEKLAEDELTSILTKTYDLCRVPPLPDPNVSYNAANFAGVASEAEKDDLGEHLKVLLPPALFIVDDWEDRNKVLGIQCLSHILENTVSPDVNCV
ncbi:TELO2-interacting protein 2 [Portunus trituberculatus]|uniref:TELO2-interacting protein 2 n=1 Tax=Portunus trituberculatus TaxID=210409 RepID=A0A5B7GPM0_PORTR|nr:TELO2-interacting protein 2 [Portunus trituberculatus]